MNIRSNLFFPRASVAALALAASFLSLGATSAKAQFFFSWGDRAVSPMQVERMVEASGYRLTGPVIRNGPVYLANVLGRENDRERLVIDARDGRLLQRYSAEARRQHYAAEGDWASRPGPRAYMFDGDFERDDDSPTPRPPVDVYGDSGNGLLHGPFVRPAPQGSQVSRTEDPAARSGPAVDSSDPYVILAPPDVGHAQDKAKPKPQAKHKKPDATPVAQPATTPADAKPAPVAALPTANPQAAVNPDAATPAAPAPRVEAAKPEPSNPQPAASPQAAISPPVATPARAVSARPSTPAAPEPRVADIKQEPLGGAQRSANPSAAITPPVAMPARPASARQSPPATPAPRVADTKPVVAPAAETAPSAPQAKPARPKPALNDVPVAPLE